MTSPYTSWMLAFMHFHGRSAELKGSFFSFQLLTPHPVFPALSLNHADDVMCSATSWPVKTFIWLFPQTSLKWQIRPFRASSDSINQTCYLGNRDSLGNSYPHHSLPLGKCGYREWGHQGDRNQARRNWGGEWNRRRKGRQRLQLVRERAITRHRPKESMRFTTLMASVCTNYWQVYIK